MRFAKGYYVEALQPVQMTAVRASENEQGTAIGTTATVTKQEYVMQQIKRFWLSIALAVTSVTTIVLSRTGNTRQKQTKKPLLWVGIVCGVAASVLTYLKLRKK